MCVCVLCVCVCVCVVCLRACMCPLFSHIASSYLSSPLSSLISSVRYLERHAVELVRSGDVLRPGIITWGYLRWVIM